MAETILHITTKAARDEAQRQGVCRAPSLESEGFIHFSKPDQVVAVANFLYRGVPNLVLLYVLPENLAAQLVYEALGTDEAYPHLYGPLNLEAVIKVVDFLPQADGTFKLPKAITGSATQSPGDA